MKFLQFLIFTMYILSVNIVYPEELVQLETLWNEALINNISINSAESDTFSATINLRYYSSLYAPSVLVEASNTFAPNPQREQGSLSDESYFSLVYVQPFPGGAKLTNTISYDVTRVKSQKQTYAIQLPTYKISLSHGINPWWRQGLSKDPELGILENDLVYQKILLSKQIKNILISLTRNYIELRKIEREIAILESSLRLHNETVLSYEKLVDQGAVSITKLWDEKQLIIDDNNELLLRLMERERLKEELRQSCGIVPENTSCTNLPFISLQNSRLVNLHYSGNLDFFEIETISNNLFLTQVLKEQNAAPIITVSTEFLLPLKNEKSSEWTHAWTNAVNDKQKLLYTISVGVDLSPILSGNRIRNRILYESNLRILEKQKIEILTANIQQVKLINDTLSDLRNQTEQYLLSVLKTSEQMIDVEELALQGGLTSLELQTYRIQFQRRKALLENSEDQIWYFEWLRSWLVE